MTAPELIRANRRCKGDAPLSVALALLYFTVTCMALTAPARAADERELIQDGHFRNGFILLDPAPGKLVPYGNLVGPSPDHAPVWQMAQWASHFRLLPGQGTRLDDGALRFANEGKCVTVGAMDTARADLALAVTASAEYGTSTRRQTDPWVHLLLQQEFASPPSVGEVSSVRLRVGTRLLKSELHRTPEYNPGLHAAQFLMYLTIQNLKPGSAGYGDFLWFGIPLYDDRARFPGGCMINDAGTSKFIYSPDAGVYTPLSTHDGNWVDIDKDILPIILHGLQTAWKHGFLKASQTVADYRIAAVNIGWEVPGTFDVEAQVRGMSLQVSTGAPAREGDPPSRLVRELAAGHAQTAVAFGTSLTHGGAWVAQMEAALKARYPGALRVINAGEGAKWSTWALQHLDERVISQHPDTVFLEFAINDAYAPYATTVEQARANLGQIVDRILASNPQCEVILQVMNPPTGEHLAIRPEYRAYYEMYRQFAVARGLRLVDHTLDWGAVQATDGTAFQRYMPDGIHPSEAGCEAIITPHLLRALGASGQDGAG